MKKILENEQGQQILETLIQLWGLASLEKKLKIKKSHESFWGYNNCEKPYKNYEV